MIDQAQYSPLSNRVGHGLGRLALVLGAAWALSGAAPTPARALDTGWQKACTFANSPQGYGDMVKERACIRQNDCAAMADARGGMMTGMGCFGVMPSAPAVTASTAQPARRR